MFKDFHRRLQRDLKKIVDARVLASDARLGGELKVTIFLLVIFFIHYVHDAREVNVVWRVYFSK